MSLPRWFAVFPFLIWVARLISYGWAGEPTSIFWICNVSNLLLAMGLALASPLLVWAATSWILIGLPLWLVDVLSGGKFYYVSIFTHVVTPAFGIIAMRKGRPPARIWPFATLVFTVAVAGARFLADPSLNVNLSARPVGPLAPWVPGIWSWTFLNILAGAGLVAGMEWALKRGLRAKELGVLLGLFFSLGAAVECLGAEAKPKYGPKGGPRAVPLSVSSEFFRRAAAPDFWALIPYYVGQQNGRSCSVASVAMIVNAARAGMGLTSEDKLATQGELLARVRAERWASKVGALGRGVTLDQLGGVTKASLQAYGFKDAAVEVVHAERSEQFKKKLHEILVENERSTADFVIVNFLQKAFTDDAEAGHISPIAAYDEKERRVLVLDSDREWYEPYWVSEDALVEGLATLDSVSSKNRGFVLIRPGSFQNSQNPKVRAPGR